MAITPDYVREVFKGLETGDGAAFFKQVADGVDWTVMGLTRWPATTGPSAPSRKQRSASSARCFRRELSCA